MRIGIVANGSRGDLQPFAALGYALMAAGHEVVMTANVDATDLAAAAGVKFVPMDLDARAWMTSEDGQRMFARLAPVAMLASANAWLAGALPTIAASIAAVAEGADVVIAGTQMDDYAAAVCAAHGVPLMLAHLSPWLPTA
jgi:sterol 3beta-glucosyltransferase